MDIYDDDLLSFWQRVINPRICIFWANKKAVFRSKDQIDILVLEKIIEERKKMGLD